MLNASCTLSQDLPVKPNTIYEFSIWCKGTGVGNAWIGGGPGGKLRNRFPAGTYDWQRISGSFATEPNETAFPMAIGVESATQSLWLDDLAVVPVVSLEPREYRVTEMSLAPPEAVASFLRPYLPESAGICIFGFPRVLVKSSTFSLSDWAWFGPICSGPKPSPKKASSMRRIGAQ